MMPVLKPLDLIGNTPLVYLEKISKNLNCHIYLKLEKYNLSGSSKDRAVKEMLLQALKEKKINKETTIIEPTSGNTGISLAAICAQLSLKCIIVLCESSNEERIKLIQAYGGKIVKTPDNEQMQGCVRKTKELLKKIPNSFSLAQFDNLNNMYAHYQYTGEEIYNDLPQIDALYATSGTGGSISGIGKCLKEKNSKIKIIHVQPKEKKHFIPGISSNLRPKNYQTQWIDYKVKVDDATSYQTIKEIALNEGIFLGLSSGCAISGAIKDISKNHYQNVVVFCADGGERYLSNRHLYFNLQFNKEVVIADLKKMYEDLFLNKKHTIWIKYNITLKNRKKIYDCLLKDAKAIYFNDPACLSLEDVIINYPGFYAIFSYRIAHLIVQSNPLIARFISEYAHSLTAIDIHPKAIIQEGFCIDHGSGIVIGETCKIGKNVRLYQGVTLGAKSLNYPRQQKNIKRHPTIQDNVIIYANATILGGKTVIGKNSIVGCNVVLTQSVSKNSIVTLKQNNIISKKDTSNE